jgi:DNA polymerase III epsilon subunit-like protein
MKHLNGNVLAAIDCETTGTDPLQHEITEIAIVVLNNQYEPSPGCFPFQQEMKPDKPENIDFEAIRQLQQMNDFYVENVCKSKERLANVILRGMDKYKCADLLVDWFEGLKLAPMKRIMPIAQNWVFDSGFIKEWLGVKTFEYVFHPCYRDTMTVSLFANDCADQKGEPFPYPKNNLQYLCSELKVQRDRAHTAIDDAVATAEVYRRMIGKAI